MTSCSMTLMNNGRAVWVLALGCWKSCLELKGSESSSTGNQRFPHPKPSKIIRLCNQLELLSPSWRSRVESTKIIVCLKLYDGDNVEGISKLFIAAYTLNQTHSISAAIHLCSLRLKLKLSPMFWVTLRVKGQNLLGFWISVEVQQRSCWAINFLPLRTFSFLENECKTLRLISVLMQRQKGQEPFSIGQCPSLSHVHAMKTCNHFIYYGRRHKSHLI